MVHRGTAVVQRQVPAIFSVNDKDLAANSIMVISLDLSACNSSLTTSIENNSKQ